MSGGAPYVVVIAGTGERVGKTTIATNLAVYLKGLQENLPVTLFALEQGQELDAMFSLGDGEAPTVAELLLSGDLAGLEQVGEYGVSYLSSSRPLELVAHPARLRRVLSRDRRGGVVIIDAGNQQNGLWRSALWAADLVLVPVSGHRSLPRLKSVRQTLLEGGGTEEMVWLLPSFLGISAGEPASTDTLEFLRLAATERGCQVLKLSLSEDQRVHRQASAQHRPVLTRLPDSYVHEELKGLSEFVLRQRGAGPDPECQRRRLAADGLLPRRGFRVELSCALCGGSSLGSKAHYLEALPMRYRGLVHESCLADLLSDTRLAGFLPLRDLLLIETGIEGSGLRSSLRLLLHGEGSGFAEQDSLVPQPFSGWDALLRSATGRNLNEQQRGVVVLSIAADATELLTTGWYRPFRLQRHNLLRRLRAEEF